MNEALGVLIRESESPVEGWQSLKTPRRERGMPSTDRVRAFWRDALAEISAPPMLERPGDWGCWACGNAFPHALERAHILPAQMGGSMELTNLHLLCRSCHTDSEDLWGEDYWRWLTGGEAVHISQA